MQNNDDATGQYLNAREKSYLTPLQERALLKAEQAKQQAAPAANDMADAVDAVEGTGGILDTAIGVAGDIGAGAVAVAKDVGLGVIEAPRQALGGFLDATGELAKIMNDFIPLQDDPEYLTTDEARSTTGGAVRSVSQFLTGFIPALKGVKAAGLTGKLASGAAAGAITDATVFDPQEDRLSNLIEAVPELQNPITGYLAANPDDSDAEGRFKSAIEGLGLGAATDALFAGLKAMRAARIAKADAAQIDAVAGVDNAAVDAADDVGTDVAVVDAKAEPEFIPFEKKMGNPDGNIFSMGGKKADPERALNINLARVNTTKDVERLIEGVAKADAGDINKARREVVGFDQQEALADELGMSVDDLLARRSGQAFNAEQALASRKVLIASGENLIDMAKVARSGSDEQVAQFRRAAAQHRAIQAQVSGMTAEAGRALGSFRIIAQSGAEQQRAIKEALEAGGGIEQSKEFASMIAELDNTKQVNTFIKQGAGARTKAALFEAWINGLLSSPATHTVNALGNTLTAIWNVGERKVASTIGQALGRAEIPAGESSAMLYGSVNGFREGMALAWKALKTGEPSDVIGKIEVSDHRAITAENLELTGALGQAADFVGEVVRIPGRLLTAGDELFKSIGYRSELHAQAFRQAHQEGLDGEAAALRMTQIIDNPPENIHLASVDAARYITFTKPLGETGKAVQGVVSKVPGARIIVPFIRTPTNIIKYVGERTVLAPMSKAVRAEIAAGGARRDLAYARIATGSMVMAAAADWAGSGQITGKGPGDPATRKMWMQKYQPYSFKVGDQWIAYNRLDPIGATIGIAADIAAIIGQTDEATAGELAASAVIATAQNVTSKTYLSGLAQFFDVMSGTSADTGAKNTAAMRWVERMAGSVVPAGVSQLERTMDPTLRATDGIIEKIQSRIPGWSDSLPPRRNIYGEPIVLEGGIGPDIMSPVYVSTDENDPLTNEIIAQQTPLNMPKSTINGAELDNLQYDKYILNYASGDNQSMRGVPLRAALERVMNQSGYAQGTDGPEGSKSMMIRSVFEAYRDAAKGHMIKEDPKLEADIIRAKRDKATKLTGEIF